MHKDKGAKSNTVNDFLGRLNPSRANPSRAEQKDIPNIPNIGHTEESSMDEWRNKTPCFLDMHARDHKLSRREWDGPLGERW